MNVKKINSSHNLQIPAAGWRSLGYLDLPVGPDLEKILEVEMAELLAHLKLQTDFLNRILRSSREAAARVVASIETENHFRHIHIYIFVPQAPEVVGKTWGFFRIERLEDQEDTPNHTIELYLYMED